MDGWIDGWIVGFSMDWENRICSIHFTLHGFFFVLGVRQSFIIIILYLLYIYFIYIFFLSFLVLWYNCTGTCFHFHSH